MGYQEALEAAGAEVHAIKYFGSYQGDIFAKVTYDGKTGWLRIGYGSCSGCDAYAAEFWWDDATPERLAAFGQDYLDNILTQEQAESEASRYIDWDMEAREMLDFVKQHAIGGDNG